MQNKKKKSHPLRPLWVVVVSRTGYHSGGNPMETAMATEDGDGGDGGLEMAAGGGRINLLEFPENNAKSPKTLKCRTQLTSLFHSETSSKKFLLGFLCRRGNIVV